MVGDILPPDLEADIAREAAQLWLRSGDDDFFQSTIDRALQRIARLAWEARGAEDGWRDVKSGPKDETRVLLFNPDEFGSWTVQAGAYYEQLGGWQYDGETPAYSNAHPPSHWQPLPPPPSRTSDEPAQEPGA